MSPFLFLQFGTAIVLPSSVVVGVLGDLLLHFVIQPARIWKLAAVSGDDMQFAFSDLGLSVISPSATIDTPWSTYQLAREKADYYFLDYKTPPISMAIRKSSFRSNQDEAKFRTIVSQNLRSKLKTNRTLDSLS